jgi:hypothetical protein
MTGTENKALDSISVTQFWSAPSVEQYPVHVVLDGRNYTIPRNWIVTAALIPRTPQLSLTLRATYPDMNGVTADNLSLFEKGFLGAPVEWSRHVISIEHTRSNLSSRKFRIPDQYGDEINEKQAKDISVSDPKKTLWFNGDGSRITAYNDHGGIIGWDDVLETGGTFYWLRYGRPLVEHWRDIRKRAHQIMTSFLSV